MAKFTLTIEGDTAEDGELLSAIGERSKVSLNALTKDPDAWVDDMVKRTLYEERTKPPKPEPKPMVKPEAEDAKS